MLTLKHLLSWLAVMALVAAGRYLPAAETHVIAEEEIVFHYHTECMVKAAETTPINNPVSWRPVKFVVPDGSFAKKGQKIVEFDPLEMRLKYEQMLLEKNVVDLELQGKLLDIDEQSRKIADQIKEKEGQLDVLHARLKRLKSLPLKTDVTVAAGRLRIARLELEAAQTDWKKAQDRFEKKFLSASELKRYEHDLQRKEAQFEYRETMYRLSREPAPAWDIETIELQIKNAELNLKKLNFENDKQRDFINISKNSAQKDVKRFERRLNESKEELDKLIIESPADGFIVYTERFKRDLAENGGKMWRRRNFINIPHIDGLYVSGMIPEHLRPFISKGDSCDVYIPGTGDAYIKGEISFIATQPSDIKDLMDGARWGDRDQDSGIKVYEMKIVPLGDMPSGLRPRSHVKVVVHGQMQRVPAIPSEFVASRDGVYYISRNGVYEAVDGTAVNGWFHLNNPDLLGETIQLKGEYPLTENESGNKDLNESGRLVVSGEISAVKQTPVRIQDIGRSAKVIQLIDEGTHVKKGDLLLTLDDSEAKEELTKREESLKDAVSEREKVDEEVKISARNGNINLQISKNNLRISELKLIALKEKSNEDAVAQRKLNFVMAHINLEESEAQLNRLRALPKDRVSRTEMEKAERDFQRKQLLLEKNKIMLDLSKINYDYYTLKQTERELFEAQLALENLDKRLEYEREIGQGRLLRARTREQKQKSRHEDQLQVLENLKVYAPTEGIVGYNVIYDSGELGKVKRGSTIRRHQSPVTIEDFSQTMVNLEVPEQAYPYISDGDAVSVILPSLGDAEFDGVVTEISYLFQNKQRKDISLGMYANREPLGQTVFNVRVRINAANDERLKPGMQVRVSFPLNWPLREEPEHAH